MRNICLFLCTSLLLAPLAVAQPVPEGVHRETSGPSAACGIIGANALAIRDKLKADRAIVEEPSGSNRFETYFS